MRSVTTNRTLDVVRCNIGTAELQRRRWIAVALSVATVVLAIGLVASHVPALARVIVWPFAAGAAVTWLQVTRRFCVQYGARGLENFGPLGAERPVDPRQRAADARRAALMIGEGILAGALATLVLIALPL
jgi:hypothetical protein